MHVVETLVALVEHSLQCEPTPVPAFQLVLNAVGAGPGTSRIAVADVLAESAAVAIIRHIPCVPLNVNPEAVLDELATWTCMGAGGGGNDRWRSAAAYNSGGNANHAMTGFGLSRVVPLDPLVAFVAVAGSGTLEERIHAAFWTLDRDGAGYLILDQLLRLSGLLAAVAAAGRVVLNQPPLSRGFVPEAPLGVRSGVIPNGGWMTPGTDSGMAAAAPGQPQVAVAPAAASSGTATGDESLALLDAALLGAFHEHCLPAAGSGGPPARLTADRLALVVQSAAEYITMAVVHRATSGQVVVADGSCGHPNANLHNHHHQHHQHHHQHLYHHISRRSFRASGSPAAAGSAGGHTRVGAAPSMRSSAPHSHHSPRPYHHQRQHSSHNPLHTSGLPPLPCRSQRSITTATMAPSPNIGGGGGGGGRGSSGGHSPNPSQVQLNGGQCQEYGGCGGGSGGGSQMTLQFQNQHSEGSMAHGSAGQLLCIAAGGGLPCGDANAEPMHKLEGSAMISMPTDGGGGTPFTSASATLDPLNPIFSVRRRRSSSAAVTSSAPGIAVGTNPSAANGEPPHTTSSSWIRGWMLRRAAPNAPPLDASTTTDADDNGRGGGATTDVAWQPSPWLTGRVWAVTSYIGSAIWSLGRPSAVAAAAVEVTKDGPVIIPLASATESEGADVAQGVHLAGPPTVDAAGTNSGYILRPGAAVLVVSAAETPVLAAQANAALPRGQGALTTSIAASSVVHTPSPARVSPLSRVRGQSDAADAPDSPLQQAVLRHSNTAPLTAATAAGSGAGAGAGSAITGASQRTDGSVHAGTPGYPIDGDGGGSGGGNGVDAGRPVPAAGPATTDVSSFFGRDAGPALLAALTDAAKSTPGVSAGGSGGVEGAPAGPAGANGGGGGGGAGGGGNSGVVISNPGRTVSGLLTKWRRTSKSAAMTGDATGSQGQAASSGTLGVSCGGVGGGGGTGAATATATAGGAAVERTSGRDGSLADDNGGLSAALAVGNMSNGGRRRRTPVLQGFTGGGDGSVHGGGSSMAPPRVSLDPHLLFGSLSHAPHFIEEAASRAEMAAKVEAAAAASRRGAAAVTAGGAGGASGGREAAAAPAGAAGGTGRGGGTVLPPLQRAIRSSVKQAGVKLFLHCGVCLLAIIALLLLDAALIAWIYLDRKQRLSRSLVIVAATNTGLVLLVLVISIARSFMADRAAAVEAAAARQAARGGGGAGASAGGASGVLGFLISNFVTPTLQTMGIIRGPEDAAASRAIEPGATGGAHGDGGHEGGGWGSRLRVLWTTIGRVAGFDTADDHGSGGSGGGTGGSGPGGHAGLPHVNSNNLVGPQYDYTTTHGAFDIEARGGIGAGASAGGTMSITAGSGVHAGMRMGRGAGTGSGGGNGHLGSNSYSPDGRPLGIGAIGSPFTAIGMAAPEAGVIGGSEAMAIGGGYIGAGGGVVPASSRSAAVGCGVGLTAGDARVGGGGLLHSGGGPASLERTRGSALPAMYYASVPIMQRVEAAYPAL